MNSKTIKTTYQNYAKSLDHASALVGVEVNEVQAKSLYKQISYCPIETINLAFRWYVYHQDDKYPSNFLRLIVRRCKELYHPPSVIEIDGVKHGLVNVINGREKYLPVDEIELRRIENEARKPVKKITSGPPGRHRSMKELSTGIVKGIDPPKEQKVNAADQVAKLKEWPVERN